MDTTKLIVEYLVAGTLTIVAIALVAMSFFPKVVPGTLTVQILEESTVAAQVGLATIFVALAYALGIVVEYVGERCFEWLMTRTKRKRMLKFLRDNEELLANSPILRPFLPKGSKKGDVNELADCIGVMRFYVISHSTTLCAEIAAQINRFRLIRALFLVEVILLVAIVGQLVQDLTAALWWAALLLITAIAVANYFAVRSRFGRYCRAVERSYKVLLMDQIAAQKQADEV
jgi:hypothetical protein